MARRLVTVAVVAASFVGLAATTAQADTGPVRSTYGEAEQDATQMAYQCRGGQAFTFVILRGDGTYQGVATCK